MLLCDRNHIVKSCPSINKEYFYCHNKGHTRKFCCKEAKANNKVKVDNFVQMKGNSTKVDDDDKFYIFNLSTSRHLLLVVEANINGTYIEMEVDTGASRSIINMETCHKTSVKSLDTQTVNEDFTQGML